MHSGQNRKQPERGTKLPNSSKLGSNKLYSPFLSTQLQTLKISDFHKIMTQKVL